MKKHLALLLVLFVYVGITAQHNPEDPFKQLGTTLPTANEYRNASGAPGHQYWQTRADYKMNLTLSKRQ